MIIKEKLGNLKNFELHDRVLDVLPLQWYETRKRILHKRTLQGRKLILKFLNAAQDLQQDDVIYADEKVIVAVEILPWDSIIIRPETMAEMASLCYEIGNKHLPLFYEDDAVVIPYEAPLFRWLSAAGFPLERRSRKLLHPLRTTISPHAHLTSEGGIISKVIQMTNS